MRRVFVDFILVATSSAGLLYLALQSVAGIQYCGSGFRVDDANCVWALLMVIIFSLGITRLVTDLKK